jgi:hypothetical protein
MDFMEILPHVGSGDMDETVERPDKIDVRVDVWWETASVGNKRLQMLSVAETLAAVLDAGRREVDKQ